MQKLAQYWGLLTIGVSVSETEIGPAIHHEIDGLDIHFIHVRSKHEECAAG